MHEATNMFIIFNLRISENQTLQLTFLSGVNHGFHLTFIHSCLLHTHEPLIGSKYGVFQMNTNEMSTLKIKLNGVYSMIEAQTIWLNFSGSLGVEW